MVSIGTPNTLSGIRVLLLGSGELGKYLTVEFQKLGIEVIACDSYPGAPAMQVAHRNHVFSMTDTAALLRVIRLEQPTYIVPEIEAISIEALITAEKEGFNVVPNARAVEITMNRAKIRNLAFDLGIKTSKFAFASSLQELQNCVKTLGFPCVVKPIMSSSGKGQSVCYNKDDLEKAWNYSQTAGRVQAQDVIVEEFIQFDSEITLLTVRSNGSVRICNPIGHVQKSGDYVQSWQPHLMTERPFNKCVEIAKQVTNELGGNGIFGVEFFIKGDEVFFSEVSPRPHDTGLVTLISQDCSQFALHVRAILNLPIQSINYNGACASAALLVEGKGTNISYSNLEEIYKRANTELHLFGKPSVNGKRRMGVLLTKGNRVIDTIEKASRLVSKIQVSVQNDQDVQDNEDL